MATKHWLMKSEPETFSIDDLKKVKSTSWDGVRNYQARNFMMNDMSVGDYVLFYHSNAEPPGIAGVARVSAKAHPDTTALDPKSEFYDPKASKDKPIWYCVDIKFEEKFKNFIPLDKLKKTSALSDLLVLKRGQRLSVQPVSEKHFDIIKKLGSS